MIFSKSVWLAATQRRPMVGRRIVVASASMGAMALIMMSTEASAQTCTIAPGVTAGVQSNSSGDCYLLAVDGPQTTQLGQDANATGATQTVAIGANSVASADRAVAIGFGAQGTGIGGTAIGANSNVSVANGTALGQNAVVTADNAVAIGNGSVADQVNTVSVGTAGGERRIVNVADGIALTDAATVGQLNTAVAGASSSAAAAQGTANTALANAATAQGSANTALAQNVVQDNRMTAIEAVNATQNTRLTSLEALVGGVGATVETNRVEANGGIAAAMAMGGAVIIPGKSVSINFNLATYRGQQGFSTSIAGQVAPSVYLTAGVAASTAKGSTGGRVGVAIGF